MDGRGRDGPRERLLRAAQRLSYAEGATVGVQTLLREADVARRSLYEHFGGKDALLAEVLRLSAAQDLAAITSAMTAAGDEPSDRLLGLFDHLAEVLDGPGFRGCRYLAADLALAESTHPAHDATRDYRDGLHALLLAELARAGHPEPERAAEQLLLLVEGVLATGTTRPHAQPARLARSLAEHVLAEAPPRGRTASSTA